MKQNVEQRKAERRQAQIPQPRTYNVRLPNGRVYEVKATFGIDKVSLATTFYGKTSGNYGKTGKVSRKIVCTFTFGTAPVERKVRIYGKVLRGKNGNPLIVSVDLPATTATITIEGEKFTARSYCKPPDKFDRKTGIKFALRHALRQVAEASILEESDYEALVKICLTKPPKLGQIKRAQKLAKANSASPNA